MRNELLVGSAEHAHIVAAATKQAEAPAQKNRQQRRLELYGKKPPATGPPLPFARPAYMDIPTWCAYTGMSRTGVYEAVAFGNLMTIKVGKKRLVDVEQGLSWLRSLAAPTSKAA